MSNGPKLETIVERIRKAFQRYNQHLQPPADNALIEELQRDSKARFGLRVPERYCDFLRITNGVNWNGVYFHGTTRSPYVDYPDMTLGGLLEETAEWWPRRKKLVLGNIEDRVFFYDQQLGEYQVFDLGETEPYRRFKEFDELFAHAFDGRFPEHDALPPPPAWDSFGQ